MSATVVESSSAAEATVWTLLAVSWEALATAVVSRVATVAETERASADFRISPAAPASSRTRPRTLPSNAAAVPWSALRRSCVAAASRRALSVFAARSEARAASASACFRAEERLEGPPQPDEGSGFEQEDHRVEDDAEEIFAAGIDQRRREEVEAEMM